MAGQECLPSNDSNETCSYCCQIATMLCTCLDKETFLCYQCIGIHYQKYPQFAHPILPIQAKNVGFEDFQKRSAQFKERKDKMIGSLGLFDKCCEELNTETEKFVGKVYQYRDEKVRALQEQKAILEREMRVAVDKAMPNFEQSEIASESKFENYLRGYTTEEETFFKYTLNFSEINQFFNKVLSTENDNFELSQTTIISKEPAENVERAVKKKDSLHPDPCLPCISGNILRFFDFNTTKWGEKIKLSIQVRKDKGSRYTMIDDDKLFCSGKEIIYGRSSMKKEYRCAYLISLSGDATQLPDMLVGRCHHGVIYAAKLKSVFVFGGLNTSGEAMKLDQSDLCWEKLPDMSCSRDNFNPCLLEESVFLCGGSKNTSIDMYQTDSQRMVHSIAYLPDASPVITLVDGESIVVLMWRYIVRFQWMEGRLQIMSSKKRLGEFVPIDTTPVVFNDMIFFTQCVNRFTCYCVSLSSGRQLNSFGTYP